MQDTNIDRAKLAVDNQAYKAAATGKRPLQMSVGSWSTDESEATTPDHPSPSVVNRRYFNSRVHEELLWVIYDLSGVPPASKKTSGTVYNEAQREVRWQVTLSD